MDQECNHRWVFYLKYLSASFVLIAIVLHTLDVYPINIIVHLIGAIGWTIVGYMWKENSILLNFAPQILIFSLGLLLL
jgi:uncharacterized membrane protein